MGTENQTEEYTAVPKASLSLVTFVLIGNFLVTGLLLLAHIIESRFDTQAADTRRDIVITAIDKAQAANALSFVSLQTNLNSINENARDMKYHAEQNGEKIDALILIQAEK